MATVHELGQKGIDLPMVFDDVLVNFDQLRTEAAVDTLCEFAEENRQILFFTCHLHLAHLFESRGVEPPLAPRPQPAATGTPRRLKTATAVCTKSRARSKRFFFAGR